MKRMEWMVIIVAALVLASFTLADAQRWGGKGRWGSWAGNYYHWNWNPATVETVKGEVMTKDIITPPKGRSALPAVGMTLKRKMDMLFMFTLGRNGILTSRTWRLTWAIPWR